MSTYLGKDVLDQTTHNMRESIRQAFSRKGALLGSTLGRRAWDDDTGQALPVRTFSWFADGRAAIAALRAFVDARKGRVVPFWVPTFAAEIPLAAQANAGASTLVIKAFGYTRYLFPVIARRYLAIVRPAGSFFVVKVSASVDNGDGTESLSLTASLPEDVPATRLVNFFTLCRLEQDETPIAWTTSDHAEAQFSFRELPLEVPA